MDNPTAHDASVPFAGEDWFDPLEAVIRVRLGGFIEALVGGARGAGRARELRAPGTGQGLAQRAARAAAGGDLRQANRGVRQALAGLFGGKVGKEAVSQTWRTVRSHRDAWCARDLSGGDVVRLSSQSPPHFSRFGPR